MKPLIPTIITILAGALAAKAAPQIEAPLQPDEIGLGESARLTVTLSDASSSARPQIPEVDGLRIEPAGQSSQIRIINGQTSSSLGFSYRVTAQRTGDFEIPPISAQNLQTDVLKLRVNKTSKVTPPILIRSQWSLKAALTISSMG